LEAAEPPEGRGVRIRRARGRLRWPDLREDVTDGGRGVTRRAIELGPDGLQLIGGPVADATPAMDDLPRLGSRVLPGIRSLRRHPDTWLRQVYRALRVAFPMGSGGRPGAMRDRSRMRNRSDGRIAPGSVGVADSRRWSGILFETPRRRGECAIDARRAGRRR